MIKFIENLSLFVPFFQTLLWVSLAFCGIKWFYPQIKTLINAVRIRVEKGSSLKAGPIELGEDLKSLEYVQANRTDTTIKSDDNLTSIQITKDEWALNRNNIYQNNKGLFLTHVIRPSQEQGQKYDIFIYLMRHKTTDISDIDYAEFFFGHMWNNTIFKEKEKNGRLGVATSAYGPFLCTCRVVFKDGNSLDLNRYIDFEMRRVFGET